MFSKQSDQKSTIGFWRILRAVLIGVFLFILWQLSPIFILKMAGVNLSGLAPVEKAEEPIYLDKNGKRINEPDYRIMVGYDRAQQSIITSHAECKRMQNPIEALGCQRYVTEQKHFPPHIRQENFSSGKTTEQCQIEVRAHWEPRIQDLREQGDDHAASSWTSRNLVPELQECENYDNLRIGKVIHEPASRLQDILKKVKDGGTISDQDRATVLNDLAKVSSFPDNHSPYKRAYLTQIDYFFQIADGKIKPPEKAPLKPLTLSCPEFQAKLYELTNAEQKTTSAQAKLKHSDGVVTDNAKWNTLNQSRIDRLWDWKFYTDGAKAAGCASSLASLTEKDLIKLATTAFKKEFPKNGQANPEILLGNVNNDGITDFAALFEDLNDTGITKVAVFLGNKDDTFKLYLSCAIFYHNKVVSQTVSLKKGSLFLHRANTGGSGWTDEFQFKMRDKDIVLIGKVSSKVIPGDISHNQGSSINFITGDALYWDQKNSKQREETKRKFNPPALIKIENFSYDEFTDP